MRRMIIALAATAILAIAMPAHARAGFWAVTELDPLPPKLRPGVSYTVGYWVLQHGTHPFEGSGGLGRTGLRLTAEDGRTLVFDGTALPEPAHYATSITVPAGRWRVQGIQGMFAPYEIGTLTVPGGLRTAPPQYPVDAGPQVADYWGTVKPPGFPWKATSVVPVPTPAVVPAAAPRPSAQAQPSAQARQAVGGSSPWPYALMGVAAGAAGLAGIALLARRLPAVRRGPDGPPEHTAREGEEILRLG